MKKHAFIFDMDGVLIDSQPVHYDADLETLAHFGVQLTRADVEPFAGTTNPVRFPMYQEAFQVQATPEEMMAYREVVVRRMFVESNAHAIKGTKELLENIHAAGYPVALASSTDPELIRWILETIGLLPYFDKIVSGEEVPKSKPEPDVFLEAARQLGAAPENCFVIEDSTNGIRAGKAAGMWVLAYKNPTSGEQDLSLADKVILADIYAAREKDPGDISSADLARELEKLGKEVHYLRSFDEIEKFILKNLVNGDLLITMGAGNIVEIGENLLNN